MRASLELPVLEPLERRNVFADMLSLLIPAGLAEDEDLALLERSFSAFIAAAWHVIEPDTPYLPNWHVDAIADHIEAMCAGEIRNLLVTMPPRMMKSLGISVLLSPWRWITTPGERFFYTSYNGDLATEHGLGSRRVIESDWYQSRWGVRVALAKDQNRKTMFENTRRGVRRAASIGGGATGKGGDWIICDDPHNVSDAESDVKRNDAIRWWNEAMPSRFNNPKSGKRIVVMQRVHEDDLAGRLIEQGGYVHLNLPMEYEPERATFTGFGTPDPRTKDGELLHPARIGEVEVTDLKLRLGSRAYAGQYQQRPAPAEGDTFKRFWWKYWAPDDGRVYPPVEVKRADGTAQKVTPVLLPPHFQEMTFDDEGSDPSYVVGQAWGLLRADRFLIDQTRGQLNFPDTVRRVLMFCKKHPRIGRKYVEKKANGAAVISTLERTISGFIPVNPQGNKIMRANGVTPEVESGNVFLPHPDYAPWVTQFVEECATFPNGRHDDQVDAMSQALYFLAQMIDVVMEAPVVLTGGSLFTMSEESPFVITDYGGDEE
jgi:predicted phage terminase large subunit-like protein